MTKTSTFQRARKPEEREVRRDAILAAAAALFDAGGEEAAGLNAIAARAGFTKSNVYRYFESREEVLLSLFLSELEAFVADFEIAAAACHENDVPALAGAAAQGFVSRPRFSALIAILSSVLERNISADRIVALKRGISELNLRVATALQSRLPGTTLADCGWVGATTATLVAGMWPGTRPATAAAVVLAMPEFAHLKPMPDRDLPRAVAALLHSILPGN